jgi:hypothetical protein
MINPNDPPHVRFLARITINGKRWLRPLLELPSNHCIEWNGWRNDSGYGEIEVDGKRWRAHRYSYLLAYGTNPGDLQVCHRCDNRPCINPHHLFLGTNADNQADMYEKARHSHGERVKQSKMEERDVIAIMKRLADGDPGKQIAKEFGIHFISVSDIKNGRTW